MSRYNPCPCASKRFYHQCCQQYHNGALPETAEKLMRSRYCAYAMGLVDYIVQTTHPDNPNWSADTEQWKADITLFCRHTKFPGLSVENFEDGDERAYVTFTAFLTQGTQDATFTEKSTFVKRDGRWFYLDGDMNEAKT